MYIQSNARPKYHDFLLFTSIVGSNETGFSGVNFTFGFIGESIGKFLSSRQKELDELEKKFSGVEEEEKMEVDEPQPDKKEENKEEEPKETEADKIKGKLKEMQFCLNLVDPEVKVLIRYNS